MTILKLTLYLQFRVHLRNHTKLWNMRSTSILNVTLHKFGLYSFFMSFSLIPDNAWQTFCCHNTARLPKHPTERDFLMTVKYCQTEQRVFIWKDNANNLTWYKTAIFCPLSNPDISHKFNELDIHCTRIQVWDLIFWYWVSVGIDNCYWNKSLDLWRRIRLAWRRFY